MFALALNVIIFYSVCMYVFMDGCMDGWMYMVYIHGEKGTATLRIQPTRGSRQSCPHLAQCNSSSSSSSSSSGLSFLSHASFDIVDVSPAVVVASLGKSLMSTFNA